MRELVARHILIQNPGGGRSTSYRLITAEELEQSGDGVIRKLSKVIGGQTTV
jgi:hypothetical protein